MSDLYVYQPWSTPLLRTSLPDEVVQELIQLTDIIVKDDERESMNEGLAGEIEDEWVIDPILLTNISFKDFIDQLCGEYCKIFASQFDIESYGVPLPIVSMKKMIKNIQITSSWFNDQKDNEYNPTHNHSGYFSGVLYLKIPKYLPSRKHKNTDGSISFHANSCETEGVMTYSSLSISPKVGDIFLFPSVLKHQVYPFRTEDGRGIRRSLAFNLASSPDSYPFRSDSSFRRQNFDK